MCIPDTPKLSEFDKTEWFDVCRLIHPDLTEEEYDQLWEQFQQRKAEYERKLKLQ